MERENKDRNWEETRLMDSQQAPTFPVKLLVDKERNKVVVAEASGDFIDTLLSFLTLPLGTIIRLTSKRQTHEPVEIGCITNLYQSVENFDTDVFWNHICKEMLLFPRNPCESLCQKLKFNVDDTGPTKYFICSMDYLLSTFPGTRCFCGYLMNKEQKLQENSNEEAQGDGVFVNGALMYLIFDDLKVLQNSPGNFIQQLVQLGYRDFNKLIEISSNVGLHEILDILKRALISKSPLSDVFLAVADGESKPFCSFTPKPEAKNISGDFRRIDLKITGSKSKDKILYAEADADFLDFLFSFLTIPLGSILKVLDGNLCLGSMDNLYKSVEGVSLSRFRGSSGTPFLKLQVAPQFSCRRQPLKIHEDKPPSYRLDRYGVLYKDRNLGEIPLKLFDPRSPDCKREPPVGFVRRPSLFAVMDDLQVMPLTSTSSFSFLQKLNVPLDDFVEHVVSIGEIEALNLLGASLTSKAALKDGLWYLLNKPNKPPPQFQ